MVLWHIFTQRQVNSWDKNNGVFRWQTVLCLIFIDSIFHERLGNVRIWPLLFMQIEFVQRWPSSHTVVICRQIWSGWDESQDLPIRGHGCCCFSVGVMGFYAPLTSLLISWRAFLIAFKFMERFHNRHNPSGARKHELHWNYETIKWLDWAVWTCGCAVLVVMQKWNEACSKVKRCVSCFSDINAGAHWTQECRASMKHGCSYYDVMCCFWTFSLLPSWFLETKWWLYNCLLTG